MKNLLLSGLVLFLYGCSIVPFSGEKPSTHKLRLALVDIIKTCIAHREPIWKITHLQLRDLEIAENSPNWFKARFEVPIRGGVYKGTKGFVMLNPHTQNWACGSLTDNEDFDAKFNISGWRNVDEQDAIKHF